MSQQQRPKSVSSRKSSAAELDEEAYPMHIIVQNMMFAYGDSEMPLERCQEFMLNLLKQQLLKIVEDAKEIARIRGKTSVGYVEMIYQFRRHPVLIKRLIQYTRVQEFAPKLYNSLSAEEDATEAATSGEDLHEEKFRRYANQFVF
ncbi:hypothetical protein AAVH_12401 [Aphelenchoides avenae]|nr:hypothetical protein AAVH_12401 [Aphelenchus avenae]